MKETISRSSRLLIDESPLQVLPSLACALNSLNGAIMLQQVHYWIRNLEKLNKRDHFIAGRWYVYNTIEAWQTQFPFWSFSTIRRTIEHLEAVDVLITAKPYARQLDQTKYYSIDYDRLEDLISAWEESEGERVLTVSDPDPEDNPQDNPQVDPLFWGGGGEIKNPSAHAAMVNGYKRVSESGLNEPDLTDYPEDVQAWILRFWELWRVDVPQKPKGKRSGDFGLWIEDVRKLREATAEHGITVLDKMYAEYKDQTKNGIPPFTVARPGALIAKAKATVGMLRQKDKQFQEMPDDIDRAAAQERIRKAKEEARRLGQSAN